MSYDPQMLDALGWYAARVESGEYQEGPCIRAMMRRHLAYLEMSKDPEKFPYAYVPALGQAFAKWCATLKWSQGDYAGKQCTLWPWQRAAADYLWSWRQVEKIDGAWKLTDKRMVSTLGIGTAKASGKTQFGILLMGYAMECDGAVELDFATFAVRQNQAFKFVKRLDSILRKSGRAAGWSTNKVNNQTLVLTHDASGNVLVPYASIGEGGSTDGGRQRMTIVDEGASIKDSTRFDELVSGGEMSDAKGTVTIWSSTPGKHCAGWGWQMWTWLEREAQADAEDSDPSVAPFFFGMDKAHKIIITQALRGDVSANWEDPQVVEALAGRDPEDAIYQAVNQVCPSLTDRQGRNGTQQYPTIRKSIATARERGRARMLEVGRASLGLWPEAAGTAFDALAFAEKGMPRPSLSIGAGGKQRVTWAAYCGSERRAAALAVYFVDDAYLTVRVYCGLTMAKTIDKEQRGGGRWVGWLQDGSVVTDGDEVLTLAPLEDDIETLHKTHQVVRGGYHDSGGVGSVMARLVGNKKSWKKKVVPIPLTAKGYGPGATALFQALAGERDFQQDGNPALHEAVRTVGCDVNPKSGGKLPCRLGDHDRIEAAMALFGALALGSKVPRLKVGGTPSDRRSRPEITRRESAASAGAGSRPGRTQRGGRPRREL